MKVFHQAIGRAARLAVAIIIITLAACGSRLTQENLNRIENGMTEEQVKAILGKPTSVESAGALGMTSASYTYKSGDQEVKIMFVNGQVMARFGTF